MNTIRSRNPSIYTQLNTEVIKKLQQKYYHYGETPFSFIETSHRSKQYEKLNLETIQLLKQYFCANKFKQNKNWMQQKQKYVCLLMPSGSALNSIFFNFYYKNNHNDENIFGQFYFFVNGLSSKKCSSQMHKYLNSIGKQTHLIQNSQKFNRIISSLQKNNHNITIHFNKIDDGIKIKLKQFPQSLRKQIMLIQNLNYNTIQNQPLTSDIAYFDTQTGLSLPGFTVMFIKKQIIQANNLKNKLNQICPDMFDFCLMQEKKSVINTPFTLCTYVMNINLKYKLENKQKLKAKIRKNKLKFKQIVEQMKGPLEINKQNSLNFNKQSEWIVKQEAQNMVIAQFFDENIEKQILQKGYGWSIQNGKYFFFIQEENINLII